MSNEDKIREYYQTLVQNAKKGESYLIKFRDNPTIYSAIPLIDFAFKTENDTRFVMRVLQPAEHRGIYRKSIEDIEILERENKL